MNGRVEDTHISLVSWQKILEEQRRLKREQEEADTASRRHTGIVPTHHQFITNERFGDLLNITDNAEKRKSGVEVQCRAVSYPSVSRKSDGRCFVRLCVSQDTGGSLLWAKHSERESSDSGPHFNSAHCLPAGYLHVVWY